MTPSSSAWAAWAAGPSTTSRRAAPGCSASNASISPYVRFVPRPDPHHPPRVFRGLPLRPAPAGGLSPPAGTRGRLRRVHPAGDRRARHRAGGRRRPTSRATCLLTRPGEGAKWPSRRRLESALSGEEPGAWVRIPPSPPLSCSCAFRRSPTLPVPARGGGPVLPVARRPGFRLRSRKPAMRAGDSARHPGVGANWISSSAHRRDRVGRVSYGNF